MQEFELFPVSSLEKIFSGVRPSLYENENSCFRNEVFSFQVAYRMNGSESFLQYCTWEVTGPLQDFIAVRPVFPVLCMTPRGSKYDDYYLTHTAALVPEILKEDFSIYIRHKEWGALWLTVKGRLPVGTHIICVSIKDSQGIVLGETNYTLTVLPQELPDSNLNYAHWFHYDGIADFYNEEVFSNRYNKIMWRFVQNNVAHGMNTLMVPLFTPPLNTAFAIERITAQLVDVYVERGNYRFGFDRLDAFLKKAEALGVKKFEMSHLYSQWGAEYAPKIMAYTSSGYCKIFGWETNALDKEYVFFIRQFLSALISYLRDAKWGADRCYFHISDEPNVTHLEHYQKIKSLIKPLIGEYQIFDALSDYAFYEKGVVDFPIATTESAQTFLEHGVKNLWVYYCCGQGHSNLSNRFISMPLQRIRILGFQLYITGCKGFLHWGYNYYNSALSERYINPFEVTDAGGSFQSGDSFIVYPGEDGPLDTLRHEVMFDAIQDYRALKLLEAKIGREKTVAFLRDNGMGQDFVTYPKSALWHSNMRKKINEKIGRISY